MDSLNLPARIDQHFPQPGSNRGYKPSEIINTLMLMQHEGGCHLDDIRYIRDDEALCRVLGINKLPGATTLGDWLRRVGKQPQIQDSWVKVNRSLLQSALHRCQAVTLDMDATEIVSDKADTQWTYNKHKGLCPWWGTSRKQVRLPLWTAVRVMCPQLTIIWALSSNANESYSRVAP